MYDFILDNLGIITVCDGLLIAFLILFNQIKKIKQLDIILAVLITILAICITIVISVERKYYHFDAVPPKNSNVLGILI